MISAFCLFIATLVFRCKNAILVTGLNCRSFLFWSLFNRCLYRICLFGYGKLDSDIISTLTNVGCRYINVTGFCNGSFALIICYCRSCNRFIQCFCNSFNDRLFCRCNISYIIHKKKCALRIVAGNNLSRLFGLNNAICEVHAGNILCNDEV